MGEIPEEARIALRKAAEWRLISVLLERPRPGWHEEIASLAQEVDDPGIREATALSRTANEEAYLALFGHSGSTSPREVAYVGIEDPGRLLADVMAYYHAFAFTPQAEDPPDHIAVEVGFLGYLALKEAYAQACGDVEAVQVTRVARDRFIEAHLGRLIRGLAENWHGRPKLAAPEGEHGLQKDPGIFAIKLSGSGPAYLIKTFEALLRRVEPIPNLP